MAMASAIPAFIPKGWMEKPSNKGTGTKYVDPNNPHNSVRLEPSKPGSSNPGQQRDYMVVTKNGQTLDANGIPVPRQLLSRIFLKEQSCRQIRLGPSNKPHSAGGVE